MYIFMTGSSAFIREYSNLVFWNGMCNCLFISFNILYVKTETNVL